MSRILVLCCFAALALAADGGAGPQAPLPRSSPLAPVQQDATAM